MRAPEPPAAANPLVTAILSGSAPRPLRLSAARGVLPILRTDLLRILAALAADADEEIRSAAAGALTQLPEEETVEALADPSMPPEVLDHFGASPLSRPAFRAAVIAHPATSADTLRRMAPTLSATEIDDVLLNLTRLIAIPDLIDLLRRSPSLTAAQASRLVEIRRHFIAPDGPEPEAPAATVEVLPPPPPREPDPPAEEAGIVAAAEEVQTGPDDNAAQKILKLNTSERVQLAYKGTREERNILIKDASRMVQKAVLESPKISDSEVETIAKMRSVSEDVLRKIAGNRDWMKNYAVLHSLATNPKTPAGVAMNLVSRLNSRDLKLIAGDKNVPEMIRRQARKVADARNQGRKGA